MICLLLGLLRGGLLRSGCIGSRLRGLLSLLLRGDICLRLFICLGSGSCTFLLRGGILRGSLRLVGGSMLCRSVISEYGLGVYACCDYACRHEPCQCCCVLFHFRKTSLHRAYLMFVVILASYLCWKRAQYINIVQILSLCLGKVKKGMDDEEAVWETSQGVAFRRGLCYIEDNQS